MIHSIAEHNKQLCFHVREVWLLRSGSCAQLPLFKKKIQTCFWRLRWDMKTSPSFLFCSCHAGFIVHWQENWCRSSRAVHSRIICSSAKKCERQPEVRSNVKNEVLWLSQGVSDDTCLPKGPAATWESSACPGCGFRRTENSSPSWEFRPWQWNYLVCHQPLRESLIKGQFECPRIRKIRRSLKQLSRIFLQSWLI